MSKILINASNLHVGGGVQVAASFIEELAAIVSTDAALGAQISIFASTEVFNNLPSGFIDRHDFCTIKIFDVHGLGILTSPHRNEYVGFDVCFTVFGPMYLDLKNCYRICGFAQPWIVYPDNPVYARLDYKQYFANKIRFFAQAFYYRRNDCLVVELDHVKNALIRQGMCKGEAIAVVENSFSSVFLDPPRWQAIDFDYSSLRPGAIILGFVGRGYVHKNLVVLGEVSKILKNQYGLNCDFIFTLNQQEMREHGFAERDGFHTVGKITAAQCPEFYTHVDGLIFPSLLECFSATPLEAMIMRKPVLASDREFVRDVCKEHAFYFDPLNAKDIASVIAKTFTNRDRIGQVVSTAYAHVLNLPTAKNRAKRYLDLILGKS